MTQNINSEQNTTDITEKIIQRNEAAANTDQQCGGINPENVNAENVNAGAAQDMPQTAGNDPDIKGRNMLEKAKKVKSDYKEHMAQYTPERQRQKKLLAFTHVVMILAGNFLVSFGFQGFVNANGFLSGGAYGLAGVLNHYLPIISFSLAVLLFSIPMLVVGWLNLDKKFVVLTTFSILMQVVVLQIFDELVIYNNDTLLASIFGGVMIGCGDGLVLRGGSGSSGIHLVAMAIKRKLGISVSTISMTINLCIVFCSSMIFGLEQGLYTLILIFVAGRVMSTVLDGISRKRTAFIVTDCGQEIGDRLMEFLNRGVTMLPGTGLYSGNSTDVLFCVVNVMEVAKLKQIVRDVDQHAFITIYETAELEGHFMKNSFVFDKKSDE